MTKRQTKGKAQTKKAKKSPKEKDLNLPFRLDEVNDH